MKEYHTRINVNKPSEEVWNALVDFKSYKNWNPLVRSLTGDIKEGGTIKMYIIPLGKTFHSKIVSFKKGSELIWLGTQGSKFLLAGKHYYKLRSIDNQNTELLHGEYFTGLFSFFIPKSLLKKMKSAFIKHNDEFKKRLEHG